MADLSCWVLLLSFTFSFNLGRCFQASYPTHYFHSSSSLASSWATSTLTTATSSTMNTTVSSATMSTAQPENPGAKQLLVHKTIPIAQQSTALAHRIQTSCKSVPKAMELMDQHHPPPTEATTDNSNNTTTTISPTNLEWEDAWFATLQLCGKHKHWQQTVDIVKHRIPASDRCRSLAIAICGRCSQIQPALQLLSEAPTMITTPAPYNAAIAACGTNRAWNDALRIVQEEMPRPFVTSLTGNAVLTALTKSSRGDEALQFLLEGFDQLGIQRDRTSYHHTIAALLSQSKMDEAVRLVLEDMRRESHTHPETSPNQETYDRLVGALVSRRNALIDQKEDSATSLSSVEASKQRDHYNHMLQQLQDAAREVPPEEGTKKRKKRKHSDTIHPQNATKRAKTAEATPSLPLPNHVQTGDNPPETWAFCKWDLPKRGKGKSAYWQLGTLIKKDSNNSGQEETIIVGLHPNRNPVKNGIQLWFFRDVPETGKRQKLGYLLMINTPHYDIKKKKKQANQDAAGQSQFLGLKVTDNDRRNGWAKIFVAVWLQSCLDANLQPCTGKMNKPLLCLVLQHSFHFTPVALSGGVRARILPPLPSRSNSSSTDTNNAPNDDDDTQLVRLTTESSSVKNLAGALTHRDIQEQHIQFVAPTEVPEGQRGRVIEVGGLLQAPTCKNQLQESVQSILGDNWKLSSGITKAGESDILDADATGGNNDNEAKHDVVPLNMTRLFLGV